MEANLYQPDPAEEFAHKCLVERDILLERVRVVDEALAKVHSNAMWHAATGDNFRKQGNSQAAIQHYWAALAVDRAIADALPARSGENGKAILCKSAAVLAMNCGQFEVAIEYAHKGLVCVCCPVVKAELEEVLQDARNKDMAGYQ